MTADHPADIAATNLYVSTRLAETLTATPRDQWGTEQCVAWIDSAGKRCTRDQATGFLCKRHHTVAQRRLSKQWAKGQADQVKAARKHAERLPALIAERDQVRARITVLDPPTRSDTAAYVGEVHPAIRKQQLARLSDTRVSELARLYDRLEKLNRVIGGDA